jgi:hypothetical protein
VLNPEGWVEEATSRETETLKYYFAKDKKTIKLQQILLKTIQKHLVEFFV